MLTVGELRRILRTQKTVKNMYLIVKVTEDDNAALPITRRQALRLYDGFTSDDMTTATWSPANDIIIG
jgi:hypothetical protein